MSLVDIYDVMSGQDVELEKAAAEEFAKLAEEDAAGRIMARGFMDELDKLAERTLPITGGVEVERAVRQAMRTPARASKKKSTRVSSAYALKGSRKGLGTEPNLRLKWGPANVGKGPKSPGGFVGTGPVPGIAMRGANVRGPNVPKPKRRLARGGPLGAGAARPQGVAGELWGKQRELMTAMKKAPAGSKPVSGASTRVAKMPLPKPPMR